MSRTTIGWCRTCNVVHSSNRGVCPRVQARVDLAETDAIEVARSWFAAWASRCLASVANLAASGVKVGRDE